MPISQYILNENEQQRLNLRLRNKWLIRIRWYYLVLLTAIAAVSTTITTNDKASIILYVSICGFGLLANFSLWVIVSKFFSKSIQFFRTTAVLQVCIDLLLASAVVYYQDGLDSRATLLYAIPILASGLLFKSWLAYTAAILSAAAYSLALFIAESQQADPRLIETTVPIMFYGSVFLILAAITDRFTAMNSFNDRRKSYSELLALLRHELHHPVGVIAALVEMLEHSDSYSRINPADRTFVRQIKYENQRMHTMISNLLQVGAQGENVAQYKSINITQLIDNAAIDCATSMKRLKDLESEYSGEAITVLGSEEQLAIALTNLIDNAFRYSEKGKKVTIKITDKDTHVEVDVSDNGKGLDKRLVKRFFDQLNEFESDNDGNTEKGDMYSLGLGLYVSKLIIEQHGGVLNLQSKAGGGTVATIVLKKEG